MRPGYAKLARAYILALVALNVSLLLFTGAEAHSKWLSYKNLAGTPVTQGVFGQTVTAASSGNVYADGTSNPNDPAVFVSCFYIHTKTQEGDGPYEYYGSESKRSPGSGCYSTDQAGSLITTDVYTGPAGCLSGDSCVAVSRHYYSGPNNTPPGVNRLRDFYTASPPGGARSVCFNAYNFPTWEACQVWLYDKTGATLGEDPPDP